MKKNQKWIMIFGGILIGLLLLNQSNLFYLAETTQNNRTGVSFGYTADELKSIPHWRLWSGHYGFYLSTTLIATNPNGKTITIFSKLNERKIVKAPSGDYLVWVAKGWTDFYPYNSLLQEKDANNNSFYIGNGTYTFTLTLQPRDYIDGHWYNQRGKIVQSKSKYLSLSIPTPTVSPSPTASASPTPTPTTSPTVSPSPTASATPIPNNSSIGVCKEGFIEYTTCANNLTVPTQICKDGQIISTGLGCGGLNNTNPLTQNFLNENTIIVLAIGGIMIWWLMKRK